MVDYDLDEWGRLFDMERLPGETDYSFRDRITAYFLPRMCIREEYEEQVHIVKASCPAGNRSEFCKQWTFHYSDCTKETITKRECKQ